MTKEPAMSADALLIASRNRHKCEEIRALLSVPGLRVVSAADSPELPEVEEDGVTFEENAVKKAVTLATLTGRWALADDSGLEVEALGGAPGVRSARYAGEPPDYAANNRKLLTALDHAPSRRARFRCVLALAAPDGTARTVEGACEGIIAEAERGGHGFGYDPLFVPTGFAQTFAEMAPAEKNALSHRGRALAAARQEWGETLASLARAVPPGEDMS